MKSDSRVAIKNAMNNPQISYKAKELIGGHIIKSNSKIIIQHPGGYTQVFKFQPKIGSIKAVRCWLFYLPDLLKRAQIISCCLPKLKCPYFVNFDFIENALLIQGKLHPVVIMDWVEGETLKEYLGSDINNRSKILDLADRFRVMVKYFHDNNIAHGDLQHGNIMVENDGSIKVVDYDSMYVRDLDGMRDSVQGLKGYQHPARFNKNEVIHPKLDYFSELVIYLSLLVYADYPSLWEDYAGTNDLLFSQEDYESPTTSNLFKKLLKSPNPKIYDLTKKLIECLKKDDILNLSPLEEMLENKLDKMLDDIVAKF